MSHQPVTTTIPPHLLHKRAVIYIRVSTPGQTVNSTGSISQQYGLVELAVTYGFPSENIVILDEDLGRSGKTIDGRYGFQSLLQDVAAGQVGAIFCLDSSRLARMSSDGALLIRLCEISGALIVDKHSVHDPRNHNAKTFLTLKSAVDEIEHSTIKDRLLSALEHKAAKGELRQGLPTGYVRDKAGKAIIDPCAEVSGAIRMIFTLLDRLGSAHGVARRMHQEGMLIPNLIRTGDRKGEYDWRPASVSRLAAIYHNPTYAGIFVRGKTQNQDFVITEGTPRIETRRVRVNQEEWYNCILGAHEGYLTWEQYEHNQALLLNNINLPREGHQGAIRSGDTLLQGLVVCATCNHKLTIAYNFSKKLNKRNPTYVCAYHRKKFGGDYCQIFPSNPLDQAVAEQLLLAFAPAQLEMSIEESMRVEQQLRSDRQGWEERLLRARREVDNARGRYVSADYKNRLVADELEVMWNQKLADLKVLEKQYKEELKKELKPLSKVEHEQLLELAKDLPLLWISDKLGVMTRKRLVRLAIEKVVVKKTNLTPSDYQLDFTIHWKSEARQTLSIVVTRWKDLHQTDPEAAAMIRRLAPDHTCAEIALALNEAGFTPWRASKFTLVRVRSLCNIWGVKTKSFYSDEPRADGLYRTKDVVKLLNLSYGTVQRLCKMKILAAHKDPLNNRHWLIHLTPKEIEKYRKSK